MTTERFLKNINILMRMHSEGLLGGETMPEDILIGVVLEEDLLEVLTFLDQKYSITGFMLWRAIQKFVGIPVN